jgi:hypothetical protein
MKESLAIRHTGYRIPIPDTGALYFGYSKNSDPAAGAGMALFTTALDLYGGVLWSGELHRDSLYMK